MEIQTNVIAFNELSLPLQKEHRAKIGVRVEAILSTFWRDETADVVRACEIQGWIDVLETCSHNEVRAAWSEYQRSGPRSGTGRLLKPDAGALWRIIVAARPKPRPVPMIVHHEPDRPRISADRAREIMAEVFGRDDPSDGATTGALGALARSLTAGTPDAEGIP
jgi:hypothetical protein